MFVGGMRTTDFTYTTDAAAPAKGEGNCRPSRSQFDPMREPARNAQSRIRANARTAIATGTSSSPDQHTPMPERYQSLAVAST